DDPRTRAVRVRALGEGALHRAHRTGVLGTDVMHYALGTERAGGDGGTVEDEVWSCRHELAVLAGERLAFSAVDDDHRACRTVRRHRAPLGRHREGSSAASTQLAALELGDDVRAEW